MECTLPGFRRTSSRFSRSLDTVPCRIAGLTDLRITFLVQQRYIVNQRLQLRLPVDYETSPRGGIYIQQRVFPQQRKKELMLDLRYCAQAMGYYQMHPFIRRPAGFTRQI
jgi:hypothetical protein